MFNTRNMLIFITLNLIASGMSFGMIKFKPVIKNFGSFMGKTSNLIPAVAKFHMSSMQFKKKSNNGTSPQVNSFSRKNFFIDSINEIKTNYIHPKCYFRDFTNDQKLMIFHDAIGCNNEEIVQYLIKTGIKITSDSLEHIIAAIGNGYHEVIDLIVSNNYLKKSLSVLMREYLIQELSKHTSGKKRQKYSETFKIIKDCFKLLTDEDKQKLLPEIITYGTVDMIKFFLDNGVTITKDHLEHITRHGPKQVQDKIKSLAPSYTYIQEILYEIMEDTLDEARGRASILYAAKRVLGLGLAATIALSSYLFLTN